MTSWLWIVSNEVIFFGALVVIFIAYKRRPLYGYLLVLLILLASVVSNLVIALVSDFMYSSARSQGVIALLYIIPTSE